MVHPPTVPGKPLTGASTPPAPTYAADIRPLLQKRCVGCHNAGTAGNPVLSGGVALDALASITGGKRPVVVPGNPVKLSKVAEGPESRIPWLGEHTRAVLTEELGLDDATIDALVADDIITC